LDWPRKAVELRPGAAELTCVYRANTHGGSPAMEPASEGREEPAGTGVLTCEVQYYDHEGAID